MATTAHDLLRDPLKLQGQWHCSRCEHTIAHEHENKKTTEAVFESRPTEHKDDADESDFDPFDDLVLPSPEGKTLFVNIASDDEAEDGAEEEQSRPGKESPCWWTRPTRKVVHAEWTQELREVRKEVR